MNADIPKKLFTANGAKLVIIMNLNSKMRQNPHSMKNLFGLSYYILFLGIRIRNFQTNLNIFRITRHKVVGSDKVRK